MSVVITVNTHPQTLQEFCRMVGAGTKLVVIPNPNPKPRPRTGRAVAHSAARPVRGRRNTYVPRAGMLRCVKSFSYRDGSGQLQEFHAGERGGAVTYVLAGEEVTRRFPRNFA